MSNIVLQCNVCSARRPELFSINILINFLMRRLGKFYKTISGTQSNMFAFVSQQSCSTSTVMCCVLLDVQA